MTAEKFRRETVIEAAWDKVEQGFGRHSCELRMYLHCPKAVIQFVLYTGWPLQPYVDDMRPLNFDHLVKPCPADIGYHAMEPQYDEQPSQENCRFFGTCYYDGSSLSANRIFQIMTREGSEGVYKAMQEYYEYHFEDKDAA
jgi:hypothetical protein